MRKDGGGGGGATAAAPSPPLSFSCVDFKFVIFSVVLLTLIIAVFQLQPYESVQSLLRSSPCPVPTTFPSAALTASTAPETVSATATAPETVTTAALTASTDPETVTTAATTALPDPNKRSFRPYGNAAALFVQMGAYRGGPATFSIIGLASKPTHLFSNPWFKCEYVPNSPHPPTRTKAVKILPDWGYGRVYTVVVVNCTFPTNPNPSNAGGKLHLYAYYSPSPRRFEKLLALEEPPLSVNLSNFSPPFPFDYLYCGSSLYGDLNPTRIREWMAYHAYFFGPRSHFVFHDAGGVTPAVRAVLEPWVKAGRATVQDIRGQAEYDGYYYNQFLVVNDCLHRYRFAANWTFYFDVDEYIHLPDGRRLEEVLGELSRFTQFTIEQNSMSSKMCVRDTGDDYSREWGFEKLVFRNSMTKVRRDRKYAIQARNALATGVHMSENVVGPTTHKTESLIRYYHYHNSINVMGEPCREFVPMPSKGNVTWFEKAPYVYDDNMKRKADAIKQFEEQTIGPIHV